MSENPSVEVATSHWLRVGNEKNCDALLAAAAHFILQVYPDEHLLWEASSLLAGIMMTSETSAAALVSSRIERPSAFPPNRCRFRKNYDICDNERYSVLVVIETQ